MSQKKYRVLLIDDDEGFADSLRAGLEYEGYDVAILLRGYEAIEKVHALKPDIILLDVMMPAIDGYHICRLFKFDRRTEDVPIIMLTARAREHDKELGATVGADQYITKPFEMDALLAAMEGLLKLAALKKQELGDNAEEKSFT